MAVAGSDRQPEKILVEGAGALRVGCRDECDEVAIDAHCRIVVAASWSRNDLVEICRPGRPTRVTNGPSPRAALRIAAEEVDLRARDPQADPSGRPAPSH